MRYFRLFRKYLKFNRYIFFKKKIFVYNSNSHKKIDSKQFENIFEIKKLFSKFKIKYYKITLQTL